MNVTSLQWPKDQPLTSPFPLRNGVFVALRSGDYIVHPACIFLLAIR